jgi:diguanylate cyclase (GGDEF)-like protein/PAS domain S-box-containing protein
MKINPNQFENATQPRRTIEAMCLKNQIESTDDMQLLLQELSSNQIEQAMSKMQFSTKEQLDSMTAAVPGVIYQLDKTSTGSWKFRYLSKSIEDLYEVTADEIFQDFNLLTHWILEDDLAAYQEAVECLTKKTDNWNHEYRIKTPGGKIKWVKGQAHPGRQDDGSVLWNGILTDITDIKLAEEELILTIRRKDQFLAMLAHELRNPLGPIRNAVQLLKMQNFADPTLEESCNIIDRQVNHMTQLLDDLVSVALIIKDEVEPVVVASQAPKYRILIVDDYVNAAESLSMLLQMEGHEIETANCGIKAIELARIFHPQVVLLDIGLPDLNGYEVARRLRAFPETQNALLIALTGYGGPEIPELTQAAGFNHYLLKPLNFNQLTVFLGTAQEQRSGETSLSPVMMENIPGGIKKQSIINTDLYLKILSLFCSNHVDDVGLIRSAYKAGDIATAVQLGHKLNDSASSMAFTGFSTLVIDLEQALTQRNDIVLEALLETTDSILTRLISETKEVIFPAKEVAPLQQLKIELSGLLENNDFINDDLLRQIKSQLSSDQQADFNTLSQHIFDTDYPKASSILDTLTDVAFEKVRAVALDNRPVILVVDDERSNQKLLVTLLAQDYHVKVAGNGPRALDISHSSPYPDLVLLDINMPGMDGYEVCQRMQDNPLTRNIPVIFVTGASDLKSEIHGLQLGAVDFITKPITPAITLLRVRNLMLLKQHEKKLKYLAHYDALTNIPNRVLLNDRMKQAVAQAKREQKKLAVCYLDIDGFKLINDTLGHQAGDQVLIEISLRIGKILREGDTVARLGGDEFAVLLPNLNNIEECTHTLKRLHENIALPIVIQGQSCWVTASIGISIFPDNNDNMDVLLPLADQAMYVAKQSGKNGYHFYDQP